MMLRHLGDHENGNRVQRAVESVLSEGLTMTGDLGGKATTTEITDAIIAAL
jgi:isocitrate dehydrogenase (NAD+)